MKNHGNLEKTKSEWNKPVLTILVRNNQEENVLSACKTRGVLGGPTSDAAFCTSGTALCGPCNNLSTS